MFLGVRETFAVILLILPIFLSGCIGLDEATTSDNGVASIPELEEPPSIETDTAPRQDTITIATWNLDPLDRRKAEDSEKMLKIAEILSQYDIIAIQGVENKWERNDASCDHKCPSSGSNRYHPNCGLIVNTLTHGLNKELKLNYEVLISDDVNGERYVFVFNKDKIQLLTLPTLVDDLDDRGNLCDPSTKGELSHQPFYATFRASNFDFVLLNAHTEPSRNQVELLALESKYRDLSNNPPLAGELDVILLGDANVEKPYVVGGCEEYLYLARSIYPHYVPPCNIPTVPGDIGSVDKIIMQPNTYKYEFVDSGVFKEGITPDKLADHYLVWAEFATSQRDDD